MHEDPFEITRDRFWGRNVVTRATGLHQRLKSTVTDDFEGPFTFCDPADDLRTTME